MNKAGYFGSVSTEVSAEFITFVNTVSSIYSTCLNILHLISAKYSSKLVLANNSDLIISKFQHSFLEVLTKHIPATTLAPALNTYLESSFRHNVVIDTSSPPEFIRVIRVFQHIGLTTMMERELSLVVASKVREFIKIEAKGEWTSRYTSILSDWVDHGLAELLRFILKRGDNESVGEYGLKTIALKALTDLRYFL
jgi:hypothetical protein